jgi:peptidoglycan-associated lipoprotein
LENIFFDLDKSSLRPESKIELDKFAEFLTQYPELKIEIGGHTDNRGDKVYNQKLSEARAKAVVDYLVGKGVDGKRLSWKGYGDTMPTVKDAQTEEQHQLNRRIEYTIK